jgi:hypothetical protein
LTPLIQLRRSALDLATHRGMVDPHTAFPHELFHVAVAQCVAQIPLGADAAGLAAALSRKRGPQTPSRCPPR